MTRTRVAWDDPDGVQREYLVQGTVDYSRAEYEMGYLLHPAHAEGIVDKVTMVHDGTATCRTPVEVDDLPPAFLEKAADALIQQAHEDAEAARDYAVDLKMDLDREGW